jgi:hypothetical protein
VHAGKGDGSTDNLRIVTIPDRYDLSPMDSQFDTIEALACYLTGVALDASVGIKIKAILIGHYSCLLYFLSFQV